MVEEGVHVDAEGFVVTVDHGRGGGLLRTLCRCSGWPSVFKSRGVKGVGLLSVVTFSAAP